MITIGLLSGTSMDAIDCGLFESYGNNFKQLNHLEYPLPGYLKRALQQLIDQQQTTLESYGRLDVNLGQVFADAVIELMQKARISREEILAIGFHGQTVGHYPGGTTPFTIQLGDPNVIAEVSELPVITDFRRRDMAAGGQGAPLAPCFHQHVFHNESQDRVIVNIGGISNISIIPANPRQNVQGFDTGPGNGLMDQWVQQYYAQDFDKDGAIAASGHVLNEQLSTILKDPFFLRPPPKSTGREYFNLMWLEKIIPNIISFNKADVMATLLELTAICISSNILQYAPPNSNVYLCGGGAYNSQLRKRIEHRLGRSVYTTESLGIAPEWVEAGLFAWLARQTLLGLPGNQPSVTGARHPAVLGAIYNYRPIKEIQAQQESTINHNITQS